MTIALTIKVHDGLVIAADSASTLVNRAPNGTSAVVNVYDNANKIVNLVKGLPLGIITWGSGSIGPQSMTSIFKDLRRAFTGEVPGPDGTDWKLDAQSYAVQTVADRVRSHVCDTLYPEAFAGWAEQPALGMIVVGYSAGSDHAEEWQIEVLNGQAVGPKLLRPGAECGLTAGGQPDAIQQSSARPTAAG